MGWKIKGHVKNGFSASKLSIPPGINVCVKSHVEIYKHFWMSKIYYQIGKKKFTCGLVLQFTRLGTVDVRLSINF